MRHQIPRRKIFVSYYGGDRNEAREFLGRWAWDGGLFIAKEVGVSDSDDFINSTNSDYVMQQIQKKYIGDSTITMVLVGTCTHSRRYVDWEIQASLRQRAEGGPPNGLLGIILRSQGASALLPPRFDMNWTEGHVNCYGRYWQAPSSGEQLRRWIEVAHAARTSRANLISNPRDRMKYSHKCQIHDQTH